MQLLGIPIVSQSKDEVYRTLENFLLEEKFHRIVTLNPEFLVESERNESFKKNLLEENWIIPDGVGIVLAGILLGEKLTRFSGADLVLHVLSLAEEKKYSIFLAVNESGLSSYGEIRAALLKKYPRLTINGLDLNPKVLNSPFVISENIVLCNYGAPEQEFFIENLRNQSENIRLALGVGGSFDYLTGKLKRAPRWMRRAGLEWLWRLFLQPKRFKRIVDALIIFPFLALSCRLRRKKA